MNNVSQRRHCDHAMRIIGQQRFAAGSELAGDRPVVASNVVRSCRKLNPRISADHALQEVSREP